jgi:putative DNA primase/helicase
MGEIENTFSKTELGSIKAFLSKSFDMLRRPYAKFDSRMKRQTVSGATVNKPDFLVDETGNRRFLTVPIRSVDGYHTVDMQQLWAEVKAVWYDKGEQHWLTDEEDKALAEINERFEAVQPIRELLVDAFDFGSDPCAEPVRLTATKALVLFNLPRDQKNVSAAGAALRKLTGEEPKSFGGARCWKVGLRRESSYFEQAKLLMV